MSSTLKTLHLHVSPEFLRDDAQTLLSTRIERIVHCVFDNKDTPVPVLEYACPVWHTNLQQYLSDNIETIQKRAFRCIFRGASYAEILSNVGLQTLKDRRDCICKKIFQ